MYKNKTLLVTGGTGSWGQELVRQVLKFEPKEIRIYSRGEIRQVEMNHSFNNPKLKFIIGDVADKDLLMNASKGVDYIFHMAALKHVPVCEENLYATVKTNITGTQNVIDTALKLGIPNVVYISTDKAVDPLNFYGVTKAAGEKLIVNANKLGSTRFVCVRGGNVIGSNGSVIPFFKKQIETINKVTITDKRMTRFIFSLKDAIGLIFKAIDKSVGGEIFVMKMPGVKIQDLAEVMIKELGNNGSNESKRTRIEYIGIRPGEKIDEVLVSRYECDRVVDDSEYFIILPYIEIEKLKKAYKGKELHKMEEFNSSNTRILDKKEIWQTLKKNGYLEQKDNLIDNLSKKELEEIRKKKWLI